MKVYYGGTKFSLYEDINMGSCPFSSNKLSFTLNTANKFMSTNVQISPCFTHDFTSLAKGFVDGTMPNLILPWMMYTGSIKSYAFAYCSSLTTVRINLDYYTDYSYTIGDHAFYSCPNLSLVIIDGSLYSIGTYAFAECPNLTSVYIMHCQIKDYDFGDGTWATEAILHFGSDSASASTIFKNSPCTVYAPASISKEKHTTDYDYNMYWYNYAYIGKTRRWVEYSTLNDNWWGFDRRSY